MMATADIVSGAPVVDAGLTNRTAGSSKMKENGYWIVTSVPVFESEGDLPVDRDRRGAGVPESFGRHIGAHGGLDLEVGRAADHGDARAFARGIRQQLPGLVRPAELEDANANHQDNGQRDCGLEKSRAALVLDTDTPRVAAPRIGTSRISTLVV